VAHNGIPHHQQNNNGDDNDHDDDQGENKELTQKIRERNNQRERGKNSKQQQISCKL